MLKKEIFDIGMLVMLLAIGCKKSNNGNMNEQDQFPNKIGNTWHNLVKDTTFRSGLNTDTSSVQ